MATRRGEESATSIQQESGYKSPNSFKAIEKRGRPAKQRSVDMTGAEKVGMFARNLRAMREAAGYKSCEALAKAAGMNRERVRSWENGRAGLNLANARILGQILGVDFRLIYGDDDLFGQETSQSAAVLYEGDSPRPLSDSTSVWQQIGNSLSRVGIYNQDILLVEHRTLVNNKDIVLALYWSRGMPAEVAHFFLCNGKYLIKAGESPFVEPILLEDRSIEVVGVAESLHRLKLRY